MGECVNMGEIDQILERMIHNLDKKIDDGFQRIDDKLESQRAYYATKTQLKYVIIGLLLLFLLVLALHGLGDVAKEAIGLIK